MDQIVHICVRADWETALDRRAYRAESLQREGFIHFSKPEQAVDTANRYYAGQRDLVLLWVDIKSLIAKLRWEASQGDVYPHLYGPLNLDAVSQVTTFLPDEDGVFRSLPATSASEL